MRGRVTIHNLGKGVLDQKFERILTEVGSQVKQARDEVRQNAIVQGNTSEATFRLLVLKAHEDKVELLRQFSYLIELLRELHEDFEPKYNLKIPRWYDHGWR